MIRLTHSDLDQGRAYRWGVIVGGETVEAAWSEARGPSRCAQHELDISARSFRHTFI
jgi:hypothetical protein